MKTILSIAFVGGLLLSAYTKEVVEPLAPITPMEYTPPFADSLDNATGQDSTYSNRLLP